MYLTVGEISKGPDMYNEVIRFYVREGRIRTRRMRRSFEREEKMK